MVTTHNDEQRPIAIDHPNGSGDLKKPHECYFKVILNGMSWNCLILLFDSHKAYFSTIKKTYELKKCHSWSQKEILTVFDVALRIINKSSTCLKQLSKPFFTYCTSKNVRVM